MEKSILNEVTKEVIKEVINELDVYIHESRNEQCNDLKRIYDKLCFVVEDLELIIDDTVKKVFEKLMQKECFLEDDIESNDVGMDIYNALINKISINMDTVVKDTKGKVVEKIAIIDDDVSITYKVNEDRLYIANNFVDVIEIKKDGKVLSNLLDFIDEAMRD